MRLPSQHNYSSINGIIDKIKQNFFVIGLLSLFWYLARTGTKPSRAQYPCQKAVAANIHLWALIYVLPVHSLIRRNWKKIVVLTLVAVFSIPFTVPFFVNNSTEVYAGPQDISLELKGHLASSQPSSDIFVVNNTSRYDNGFIELINLMGNNGLLFYKSDINGNNQGPEGLIGKDDLIIIKVNCQWPERGGTNTDLLKAIIKSIINHPDGFIGEIVVADNGQEVGSLDWEESNAENHSQSAQKVVDMFSSSYNISTYLWDSIARDRTGEYSDGYIEDGYIVNDTYSQPTGIQVSYPKFRTIFGTYISFKEGIWNPETLSYDRDRLKVINVPVLKTHSDKGVTACIKHYMGVVTARMTNACSKVGTGGMGAEMVETGIPTLNILDSIWINPIPLGGPRTSYTNAVRVNVIMASTDPIALDFWAVKHVLMQASQKMGYTDLSSMDPDLDDYPYFGYYLRRAMQELWNAGYQVTNDEFQMNVFVFDMHARKLSEFDTLFANNPNVKMIYPSDKSDKPLNCSAAMVSDWLASAFVYTKLENVIEGLDTEVSFVNQTTGKAIGDSGTGIISFGGPLVNPVVKYAESNSTPTEDRAPIRYHSEGGNCYFQLWDGSSIPGAELPASVINEDQDMFVIEVYVDEEGRYMMLCYGFGWKGTFAAGKHFDTVIYPDIETYQYSWIIVKWEDTNGNGFVNTEADGDIYTQIATGS